MPLGRAHGRLRRRREPNRRGLRRRVEWRRSPPRPTGLWMTARARLPSHRAGLRPAPNVSEERKTTPAPVPGETAQRRETTVKSRRHAVKCRQNLRQLRRNPHPRRLGHSRGWVHGKSSERDYEVGGVGCGHARRSGALGYCNKDAQRYNTAYLHDRRDKAMALLSISLWSARGVPNSVFRQHL